MFITVEGIEGSGKSTQVPYIRDYLETMGIECITTREPGGTPLGRLIRRILLDPGSGEIVPLCELFMYAADRAQHVEKVIRPAIAAGKAVICDRYIDSTIAYQGAARGVPSSILKDIVEISASGLKPDITFLLDLPPDVGLSRAWNDFRTGGRKSTETRFENETLDFHEKVRNGFLDIATKDPERIKVIDATLDKQIVREAIIARLESFIKDRKQRAVTGKKRPI